jgi:hypothetical protein
MWRIQSMPLVSRTPKALASRFPMIAPAMPIRTVSQSGMLCLPGRSRRAITPMINPAMMAQMNSMSPPDCCGGPPG